MKIESFPDNILNTIITPISDSTIDSMQFLSLLKLD